MIFSASKRNKTREFQQWVDQVAHHRVEGTVDGPVRVDGTIVISGSDWGLHFVGGQGGRGDNPKRGIVYDGPPDRPILELRDCNRFKLNDLAVSSKTTGTTGIWIHCTDDRQRGYSAIGRLGAYDCERGFVFGGDCLEQSTISELTTRRTRHPLKIDCHAMDALTIRRCNFSQWRNTLAENPCIDVNSVGNLRLGEIWISHMALEADTPAIRLHGGLPFIDSAGLEMFGCRALDMTWSGAGDDGRPLHRNTPTIRQMTCGREVKDSNGVSARINRLGARILECSFPGIVEHRHPITTHDCHAVFREVKHFTPIS